MKRTSLQLLTLLILASMSGFAQTFWESSNGLFMGKIEVFFSPADSFILASSASGVFRSVDGARTWTRTDLDRLAWFLVADSTGHIYAGTSSKGVFCSSNSGIHWAPLNSGLTTLEIRGLTSCPNGNIFAITASGIFGLAQHDTSWTLLNEPVWKLDLMVLASDSKSRLFAGTQSGTTYRSTDGGVSWVKLDLTDPHFVMRTIFVDRNDRIFRSLGGLGIQRSTDQGNTWTLVSTDDVASIDSDSTGMLFGGTGGGVTRSSDEGTTWQITPGAYALAITALDNGIVLASGLNGEIMRSVDHGVNFASISTTPQGVVTALSTGSGGLVFAGSFAYGVFRSVDRGKSWMEADSGVTSRAINSLLIGPNGEVFVATQHGVFKSVDNGESWTESDTGITTKWTFDLCLAPGGRLFAATNGGGLFVSLDTGATWQPSGEGVIAPSIRKVVCGPNGTMYAGCYPGGLYRSPDIGAHWQLLSAVFGQYESVRTVSADTSGHVAAATDFSLKCSDDNGVNWSPVTYAFPYSLWTVFLDLSGHLYQSTGAGKVYRSDDFGTTWSDFSSGLPVNGLAISSFAVGDDGHIFAGTGTGVFRSIGPTVATVHAIIEPPRSSTLAQNFPNPFNPVTEIEYSIGGNGATGGGVEVQLLVYDALGRRVATLVDAREAPGQHKVTLDGSRFASGVYFYQLRAGRYVETRKLVLTK
jgi:ligand-binding sensor domain-containing protein